MNITINNLGKFSWETLSCPSCAIYNIILFLVSTIKNKKIGEQEKIKISNTGRLIDSISKKQ